MPGWRSLPLSVRRMRGRMRVSKGTSRRRIDSLDAAPPRAGACGEDDPHKGRAMLKVTDQLFDEFVHFVMQHRSGERYTRDPHQAVPPDCGFVRFRTPGGVLFTSAGLVQFRTWEEQTTS